MVGFEGLAVVGGERAGGVRRVGSLRCAGWRRPRHVVACGVAEPRSAVLFGFAPEASSVDSSPHPAESFRMFELVVTPSYYFGCHDSAR